MRCLRGVPIGLALGLVLALLGCKEDGGSQESSGCKVMDNTDGSATVICADGSSATISNGADGEDGAPGVGCSVIDLGDGSKQIACGDGSTSLVYDGAAGPSCRVTDNGDSTKTITCQDGTFATVHDGDAGCTIKKNDNGTKTIVCEDGTSATITENGEAVAGSNCTVKDNGNGSITMSCDDGTSATVADGKDGADGEDGKDGRDGDDGENGKDGSDCSVKSTNDGSVTISCDNGSTATIKNHDDEDNCTVTDLGDKLVLLSCKNGTSAVLQAKEADECVLRFDDVYATDGYGADPDAYYDEHGVSLNNDSGFGVIDGESNGDTGNWYIEGTNGPAAWGLWSGAHSISFNIPTDGLSIDFLRGHQDVSSVNVIASLDGTTVETKSFSLSGDTESVTVTFSKKLDKIFWTSASSFGVDNVVYKGYICP